MEDMVTQGAAAIPAPQPDLDTNNIEIKKPDVMATKQETSVQTSGGSMMGMPTSAIQNVKTAGANVPTAQSVAGEQKVYGQSKAPERAPIYKAPVNTSEMFAKKPYVEPEQPVEPQISDEVAAGIDPEEWKDFGVQVTEEDAGDFAAAQAAIGEANKSGDKKEQKDVTDSYFNKAELELKKKADSKWPLWATIASVALFAFTDGNIPPVNFVAMTGQKEAQTKWSELLKEKARAEAQSVDEMRGAAKAGEVAKQNKGKIEDYTKAKTEITAAGQGKGSELGQKEMENAYNILEKQLKLTHQQAVDLMKAQTEENTKSQIDILEKMRTNTISINDAATKNQAGLLADTAKQWGIPLTKDGLIGLQRAMLGESTFSKYSGQVERLAESALQLLK